ncbi:hypothetical protein [Candidatus Enterococcus mansonii]|uniref:Uncharacterized protein n=1 Tax=Candidatus Enterococcus mansonii TaxID=1834181 RepID=A0A242CHC6_9ENTE|nr:hypothetical protein [Enterococcus sp. 4G2_DIV0659]OTO09635.1 hypothetical protein A5880_000314 [Enterococcus sp. 4G2_DIV0659]
MAVEQIKETDTLNQGRIKINAILDQSNASSAKVDDYQSQLKDGIAEAKKIADEAGKDAVEIATEAGNQANETASQAMANSKTAITTADQAVSTANNNKQEFDTLRNDFDQLVAESGDSNPEIVQARTDTQGIKQATLANRLQIDFADRMTKAEGISLLVGSSNIKIMMDFVGKTAGNTATNPNKYFSDFTAKTLKKPSDTWNEVSQADYNKLASRDDSGVITGSTQSGVIPQQRGEFNIIEIVKALIPQIFEGLDKQQSVEFIKKNFTSFTINERVKATSPNNKNIKVSTYLQSTDSWSTQIQESAPELKDFSVQINDKNFITDEGFIHLINYTDPSNGVTSSSLETDYSGIQIELSVNAQDILEKSGFAKTEDVNKKIDAHVDDQNNPHNVTKKQVGLENVSNVGFANDGEAVAGTNTNKYMHPKNVSDAIKGQAVTQIGEQTVEGIKNFVDGLQSKGVEVVTSRPYKRTKYTALLNGATGFVEVEKLNGFITIKVSVQTNKAATAGWLNFIKLPEEYRIAQDKVQYGAPDPSSTGYPHQHGATIHFYNTGDIHFGKWSSNNVAYLATVTTPAANDL